MLASEKVEINTDRLYYSFPVVLLGYKDDKFKYNATTISSTYTLGDTMNIGVNSCSYAIEMIKKYGQFTINVPCKNLMSEIEICGFFSKHNKLQQADLPYTIGQYVDAPLVDDCFLSIECEVVNIFEYNGFTNITADIKRRVVFPELLDDNNNIKAEEIETIHYAGCNGKRVYRYLTEEAPLRGEFVEGGTSQCG